MVDLAIPARFRPGLAVLLRLPTEAAEDLREALGQAPSTLSPRKLLDAVSGEANSVPPADLPNVLETLRSLYSLRAQLDLTAAECARSISEAIETGDYDELTFNTKSRLEFENSLERLLDVDSLAREAKALDLVTEHQNVFHAARVITDIRPVFGPDVSVRPEAAVILHELKITYHQGDDLLEFFVSLDGPELDALGEVLDRAKEKEKSIGEILRSADLPNLNFA